MDRAIVESAHPEHDSSDAFDQVVVDGLSFALDETIEHELWWRLPARRRDVTCLVVPTARHALANAERVVVLDGDRVVANP